MAFEIAKSKADLVLEREEIVADKTKPIEERKAAFHANMQEFLNPDKDFDPATFDPMKDDPDYDIKRRLRKQPPNRLPTLGLLPKELLEGQMVGMYESKQDLYLIMAHYINQLLDRVEELESKVGNNV